MAGIVPALKTDNGISPAGAPIDDLALAVIAQLRTDHSYIGHSCTYPPALWILNSLRQDSAVGMDMRGAATLPLREAG